MTVCTPHLAFLYFRLYAGPAPTEPRRVAYVCVFFSAHMVKFKYHRVFFVAVNTRMRGQIVTNFLSNLAQPLVLPLQLRQLPFWWKQCVVSTIVGAFLLGVLYHVRNYNTKFRADYGAL